MTRRPIISASLPCLGGRAAWFTLVVLMLVYVVNVVDRQILSILAQDIKHDLGISDADLGYLYGTAFAIFFSLFGIPFGRLADTWYRGRLIALGLAFWSTTTMLSGLATSYPVLSVARMGVAIGESSATPAAWSMLADLFPKDRRALVNALYAASAIVGGALSLPIGGWIATSWTRAHATSGAPLGLAGWQATFIAVGSPGLVLAIVVACLREPPRGLSDGAVTAARQPGAWRAFATELTRILPPLTLWSASRVAGGLQRNLLALALVAATASILAVGTGDLAQWVTYGTGVYAVTSWVLLLRVREPETYRLTWGAPAVTLAIAGFGLLALLTVSFLFWIVPYALRTFGIDQEAVGLAIGLPTAVMAALGLVVGGRLSDAWLARDPRGRIFVCMLSAVLPIPFVLGALHAAGFIIFAMCSAAAVFMLQLWGASAVSAMQDFVPPRLRGTIMATHGLGATMIGSALGPYLTGKVATVTGSLQAGLTATLLACPLILVCLWLVTQRLVRTPVAPPPG